MAHKEIAVAFVKAVASGHVREAYEQHVGKGFKHHNPFYPGDATSLMKAMEEGAKRNPSKVLHVHAAIEEGDRVVVFSHVRQKPTDAGGAVVHIFRFEANRIVELWDVWQEIPKDSVNEYGMF